MAARQEEQQNGKPEKDTGHLDVRKNILMNDALYEYILKTSVFPREPQPLKELRAIAEAHEWSVYASPPDEVQFLSMLLKLINAKKTIEIGVFTGYSLLATALAIPADGKIIALDINREYYELGLPIIEKAGVAHKIDFKEGPALPSLDQLLQDVENHDAFDFIFIDADKKNSLDYHERALKLVKVGGLIVHDNTLWFGTVVAPPEQAYAKSITFNREHVWKINKALAADSRVEASLLSLGDGVTLCRRLI